MSYFVCYDVSMKTRPAFEEIKTFEEFSKYYWYREELVLICRRLGICATGYKAELNQRIEDYFNGKPSMIKKSPRVNTTRKEVSELSLETKLIECNFRFSQRFRDFFSEQTGIKNFKFNADMVASARKVREIGDTSFTLGNLLDVFYGKKTYAKYDKVSLQWNKFVKDFCEDEATKMFSERLKAAAALWKIVRESDMKKEYSHDLLEKYKNDIGQVNC